MKIAMLQTPAVLDREVNLKTAEEALAWAASAGAEMAVLPEMFACPYRNDYFVKYAEPAKASPTREMLKQAAKTHNMWIVGGSLPELEDGKIYNTSFVYDPEGKEIARHRKVHLFDIDVEGGQRFCESDTFTPGDEITVFDTPWGKMGLCICFDMRFPELSRVMALEGAQVILVPAAFNMTTGPAHWETMFRQRAVDNQCYTVAVSPARDAEGVYVAYGHSMVTDPWGTVIKRLNEKAGNVLVDLDLNKIDAIRRQLPLLSARRTDLYTIGRSTEKA